jgi:hypothetical protein
VTIELDAIGGQSIEVGGFDLRIVVADVVPEIASQN